MDSNVPAATQNMGFWDAIKRCFMLYATFTGRASMTEYWWFFLAFFILNFIPFVGILAVVPFLAVSWRRMHDTGKSGAYWLINLIPLVGWIIWIIWAVKPSEPHTNQYGEVPGNNINAY